MVNFLRMSNVNHKLCAFNFAHDFAYLYFWPLRKFLVDMIFSVKLSFTESINVLGYCIEYFTYLQVTAFDCHV